MSEEKKNHPDKENHKKKSQKEEEIDKELEQTFPASDPPSHSRPGHEDKVKDKDKDKE